MTECNKPYSITHVSELDVDDLATTVDYFLGVRAIEDESTGNIIYTPVRVPGEKVTPTGSMQNVIALTTNNSTLTVPENQVRAGYMDVQPGGNVMRLAGAANSAQFLMLGKYTDAKMLVQSTGFLRISGGHSYIVSTQYYLGEDGEPVTDSTITGQKLFIPLDDYTLLVNLEA